MATIQSSIKLTDGMTPALRSINKSLNLVISSFESMQRASARGVDVTKIRQARDEWAKANVQLDNIESNIRQNTAAQDKFNTSVRKGTSNANELWNKLKSIAGTYLGIQAVKGVFNTADALTQTTARLDLINDGQRTTKELQDKIYESAMRSRASYLDVASAVSKIGIQTGKLFKNNDQLILFTENFNKMAVVSGASTQQTSAALLQITQGLASGVLRGDELKSVLENMPIVADYIAKEMGVAREQVQELGYDGKISAAIVKNAMINATEDITEKFNKMKYTWGQVWVTMKNYVLKISQPILEKLSAITSSQKFINFADAVGNALKIVIDILGTLFDLALDVFNVFYENWSFIAPIVGGIATAFLAYKAALMGVAIWQGICTIASGALTTAKIIGVFATKGITTTTARWAASQWGLNAALWACPITWIILAIIALIVIIYLVIAAINKFAGTSYSATGFVAGLFRALGAIIWNVVAYVWNMWASFAEFFVNLFRHPTYAVKKLFVNLATNFLDLIIAMGKYWDKFATNMVNVILKAVNGIIDGWNWLADSWVGRKLGMEVKSHIGEKKSIVSELEAKRAQLQASVAQQPDDYWTAPRMEMKDVSGAFDKGYEWGKNAADGFSDNLDALKSVQLPNGAWMSDTGINPYTCDTGIKPDKLNDLGKALSGGYDTPATDYLKEIADNTSDIAASEEDISYMRDLAEREAINRYTMTDLKIEMTNNNKIDSNMDLDDVVEYLNKKVYEGVLATADGVHF